MLNNKVIKNVAVLIKTRQQLKYLRHILINFNNVRFSTGEKINAIEFWSSYKGKTYIRFDKYSGFLYYGRIDTLYGSPEFKQYKIYNNVEKFIGDIPRNLFY